MLWKFLTDGIEVAIPSVAYPMNTERFVNEIHDHKVELRSSNELLKDQKEVNSMKNEEPPASRKLVQALSAFLPQKSVPTHEKNRSYEWEEMEGYSCTITRRRILGSCSLQTGYKNGASSWPRWTTTCWFTGLGTQSGQYCWERLHKKAHEISTKDFGYTWFMKAAIRKDSNTAWITRVPCVTFEQFKDTLVVFQKGQNTWVTRLFHTSGRSISFHRGILWTCQSNLGSGMIPGGKENDKARQAVFFTPLNPFGKRPGWRRTSRWLHCSSEGTLSNLLETQSRCGMLDKN